MNSGGRVRPRSTPNECGHKSSSKHLTHIGPPQGRPKPTRPGRAYELRAAYSLTKGEKKARVEGRWHRRSVAPPAQTESDHPTTKFRELQNEEPDRAKRPQDWSCKLATSRVGETKTHDYHQHQAKASQRLNPSGGISATGTKTKITGAEKHNSLNR